MPLVVAERRQAAAWPANPAPQPWQTPLIQTPASAPTRPHTHRSLQTPIVCKTLTHTHTHTASANPVCRFDFLQSQQSEPVTPSFMSFLPPTYSSPPFKCFPALPPWPPPSFFFLASLLTRLSSSFPWAAGRPGLGARLLSEAPSPEAPTDTHLRAQQKVNGGRRKRTPPRAVTAFEAESYSEKGKNVCNYCEF